MALVEPFDGRRTAGVWAMFPVAESVFLVIPNDPTGRRLEADRLILTQIGAELRERGIQVGQVGPAKGPGLGLTCVAGGRCRFVILLSVLQHESGSRLVEAAICHDRSIVDWWSSRNSWENCVDSWRVIAVALEDIVKKRFDSSVQWQRDGE